MSACSSLRTTTLFISAGVLAGCVAAEGGSGSDSSDRPYQYVLPGKADDYRSTTGKEYALTARDSVSLTEADLDLVGEARLARAEEIIEYRFKALSFFLYAYMAGKSRDDDNYEYGNFRTTIRQQTFERLDVVEREAEPGTFDFTFEAEVGGPNDLLSKLSVDSEGRFDLILPILTTEDVESGRYSSAYEHFDPEEHEESTLTRLPVAIEAKPMEPDAYPDYADWFEDGVLDVAIHVGGDYNDSRYDLRAARSIFDRLQSDLGLRAPAASYEELRSDSGPFVGTLDANGATVELQVFLYHPDMYQEPGVGYDGLIALYEQSAASRDIVLYDGHAGYNSSYSGIVVHYGPRHAIPADDFDELDLPDKYQLFFFNGCKTYTSYADAMYEHPAKDSSNLDVITTVNFSWLSQMTRVTTDLLKNLLQTQDGTHLPRSYDRVLADLNDGRNWDVIYGVHGLSDNPRVSPYAERGSLCGGCTANSDCPGVDNVCVELLGAGSVCGAACTHDSGCPEGYACRDIAAPGSGVISAAQCLPVSGSCGS